MRTRVADEQNEIIVAEDMLAIANGVAHRGGDFRREFLVGVAAGQAAVAARGRRYQQMARRRRADAGHAAEQCTTRAADEVGDLFHGGDGEALRMFVREDVGGCVDDAFEAAPAGLDHAHVAIASQRREHGRGELLRGELGLFLL